MCLKERAWRKHSPDEMKRLGNRSASPIRKKDLSSLENGSISASENGKRTGSGTRSNGALPSRDRGLHGTKWVLPQGHQSAAVQASQRHSAAKSKNRCTDALYLAEMYYLEMLSLIVNVTSSSWSFSTSQDSMSS